jgi:hypothetical protein
MRMHSYTLVETYQPVADLEAWLESRGDPEGLVRGAIAPAASAKYETRLIDVREPALIERGNGYLFIRRGVYRESFNWWQFDRGPRPRSLMAYFAWVSGRRRFRHFPEVVSLRTKWESNFWHCHDEVLSKLLMVDRLGLPPDIPLLVGPRLWSQPFFQGMLEAEALRHRNWVVHDFDVVAERAVLPIQGPTRLENATFARDILHEAETHGRPDAAPAARLLILRPRGAERHLRNEEELIGALTPLGFLPIQPDNLPFWQQARIFKSAECVVMAHGAALANMVHRIGEPSGLVELFPRDREYVRRVYGPWLAKAAGFSYRAVVGTHMAARAFAVPVDEVKRAAVEVLDELARSGTNESAT